MPKLSETLGETIDEPPVTLTQTVSGRPIDQYELSQNEARDMIAGLIGTIDHTPSERHPETFRPHADIIMEIAEKALVPISGDG